MSDFDLEILQNKEYSLLYLSSNIPLNPLDNKLNQFSFENYFFLSFAYFQFPRFIECKAESFIVLSPQKRPKPLPNLY